MMAALALATWSVHDPSLSHATDAPVHNLLGRPGAIAADLMMQLLGLGSLALLLPIAVWGYRLLGHRPLSRERLRVVFWLFGAVLAAAFASCLPRSSALAAAVRARRRDRRRRAAPAGRLLRRAADRNLSASPPRSCSAWRRSLAFAVAAGMIWRDSPDEDEDARPPTRRETTSAWISLGLLVHACSACARGCRALFRRRARAAFAARATR